MGLLLDQTWRIHQEKLTKQKRGGRLNLRTIKQEKGCEETNGDTVMKVLEVATFAPSYYWTSKSRKFRDHQAEKASKDPQRGTSSETAKDQRLRGSLQRKHSLFFDDSVI